MSESARDRRTRLTLETGAKPATDAGATWRHALAIASDAAADELAMAQDGGWPAAELRAGASLLSAAVEQRLHGIAGSPRFAFAPALPSGRLIAAMRRSLLAQAENGALASGDAVRILTALETLSTTLDSDAAQRFASKLSGMDGLSLIVDVAHDMRSPLGSILFLAEQIRRGSSGAVTSMQERQLGLIYGAALGLSTMASDVMDLARGGERLVQQEPIPFTLLGVFQQVQDLVRPMAEERGLILRFDTQVIEARMGHAHAVQRVLLNLVTNAVKFTQVGQVSVSATALSASRVRFEVRDTGRGIPDSVMGTLFDAFRRRLKPGEYIFSSAGLGLSICQNVVRAMGSELLVECPPGGGSVFQFELDLPRHTTF